MAPPPARLSFGEMPPFSIEALRGEMDNLLAWSDQLRVELDIGTAHRDVQVEHLLNANREMSVRVDQLQDRFDHFIDEHWRPMRHFACGWSPVSRSLQEIHPSNPPSMLELEASLGLLSLHCHLDAPVPLPSPSFKEDILPSPLSSSPTLVSALTLTSPSLRSSPSPPTHRYLPPHCRQDRGSRSSATSSTPDLTQGKDNYRKENSSPYSQRQRATPRNQEQRLRMQSQQMFRSLVKEYGALAAQEAFEGVVRDLGVEMNHDVLGCRDCHWEGRDIVYCRRSRHNREHPYHECPIGQECC